ncbi:type II toxin-antitoxin system RelE/ParE family toxin [Methyloglobulus sp.]|uniref:type II toxin-antitoxin system RelE/ParE family toxin n=1 Tax=Methyloglobulus sp. TaxID=2518622 RepID=UPI0039891CF4
MIGNHLVRQVRVFGKSVRDATGIYRVMFVAKFEEAIYVLHCFQKKPESTTKRVKDILEARYRAVARERGKSK